MKTTYASEKKMEIAEILLALALTALMLLASAVASQLANADTANALPQRTYGADIVADVAYADEGAPETETLELNGYVASDDEGNFALVEDDSKPQVTLIDEMDMANEAGFVGVAYRDNATGKIYLMEDNGEVR